MPVDLLEKREPVDLLDNKEPVDLLGNRPVPQLQKAQPPDLFKKVQSFFRDQDAEIAKAQNVYALSKTTGLSLKETFDNYELLRRSSKITGMTHEMQNKEYTSMLLFPGIAASAVVNPVGTAAGVIAFGALNRIIPTDKWLDEFERKNDFQIRSDVRTSIELADFIVKSLLVRQVFRNAPKLAETFTKQKIVDYNLPKTISLSKEQVADIYRTGKLTTAEQKDLFKSLDLSGENLKQAISKGVNIEIPAEKVTQIVDKPFWAKIKSVFMQQPSKQIQTERIGQVKKGVSGLLENKAQLIKEPTPVSLQEAESASVSIPVSKETPQVELKGDAVNLKQEILESKKIKEVSVSESFEKKLQTATQKTLENESVSIDKQMRILEDEKIRLEKVGASTKAIDTKLMNLSKQYQYVDSLIAEKIIGDQGIENIKKEIASMKVGEILKEQEKIQRTSFSEGKKEGTAKEKQKVAEMKIKNRERELLKREVNKLVKDISSVPSKTMALEYQDMIEEIKSKFDLKKRSKKTLAKRDSMKEFVTKMQELGEEIHIPQEYLDLLEKKTLNDMSIDDLRDVHEAVMRLAHLGRLKNKLLASQKERMFEDVKNDLVNVITRGNGLSEDSSVIKALKEQNKSFKTLSAEKIRDYIIENLRPELMFNILDNMSRGIATQTIFDPLWESQKYELEHSEQTLNTIKEIHKDIDLSEIFVKKFDIGRFNGMTKNFAFYIYAHSLNEYSLEHLYGSGITDEDIINISNFLSDKEKDSIHNMIKFYDTKQFSELEKIYSEIEGVHLYQEENYFPIDRLEDVSYNKELEKEIMESKYIKRAGVSKSMLKKRSGSEKAFSEFDYFGSILRNMRKVEHYLSFAKSIRDVNKLLTNKDVKNAIKQNFGDKFYSVLDKWLKDVAYGFDRKTNTSIENLSKWLRTNYASAVIGGNLVSVSKAPLSFMQGAGMVGSGNAMKATLKFISNPLKMNDYIDSKSTLMKFRPMRQERELMEITSQRSTKQQIMQASGYQAVREYSMLPWVIADKTTCNIIWLAAYDSSIESGMTEGKSIDYADMVIRRTQPMSGMLNLPDTFRGPEYQKLFTLFRNQPNQNFNLLIGSSMEKKAGKSSYGKFSHDVLFYLILPSVMLGIINRKRLQENASEFSKDVLNGSFGGLIYIGNIMNMLATGFKGTTTPLESLYEDAYNFIMTDDGWKKLDKFVSIISKLSGIPYIGIKRLLTGNIYGVKEEKQEEAIPMR